MKNGLFELSYSKSMVKLVKFVRKILFLTGMVCIVIYIPASIKSKALPRKDEILPQLYSWPRQVRISPRKFMVKSLEGDEYEVVARYHYTIYGLVVSLHHSDSWIDISHRDSGDTLNIADFSLVYGDNLKGPYLEAKYSHGDWTGWVRYYSDAFDMRGFSNNHLLTDDEEIARKILSVRVGDQILIKGLLCDYRLVKGVKRGGLLRLKKIPLKPWSGYRPTSTTRDDHDCEIIYVKEIEVLRPGNPRWRRIARISGWGAIGGLLGGLFVYILEPLG